MSFISSLFRRLRPSWIVVIIFVVALIPRGIGLGNYLPDDFHPDEDKEIRRALQMMRGNLDLGRMHKGTLFMALAGEYGGLFVAGKLTGRWNSPDDFAKKVIVGDHTPLFVLSRWTVAILGALGAVLAFLLTRRHAGLLAGLMAAGLVAFFPEHLLMSREGRLDVPLCFAVLLLLERSAAAWRNPTQLRVLVAVACAGMVVSTKTSGAPYLIALIPGFFTWMLADERWGQRFLRLGMGFGTGLLSTIVFNHSLPYSLVMGQGDRALPDLTDQYQGAPPSRVEHYINQPIHQAGVVALLLALAGLFFLIKRGSFQAKVNGLLWAGAVLLQGAMLWSVADLVAFRYLLPGMLVLLVLAAIGARHLVQLLPKGMPRWVGLGVLAAIALFSPFRQSMDRLRVALLPSVPVAAREWIEANVPAGSGVLLDGRNVFPSLYMPKLNQTKESLEAKIEGIRESEPGKASLLERYWIPTLQEPGYDIELYQVSRALPTADELRGRGIRYVVLQDVDYGLGDDHPLAGARSSLASLLQARGVKELQRFDGGGVERRGAALTIYDLGG
ncbi:MAG: glycosyltransferase family 39 protein [Acidobacteriota bacterium]